MSREGARGFRTLDHTADRAIEAWAEGLPDLFVAAAEAMVSESAECARIPREREWAVAVEADDLPGLLHAWLSELLWLAERDEVVPCAFAVETVARDPWRLRARAWAGRPPADEPHTGAPVKAVTYHNLRVWEEGGHWRARVVFDV